ncbi:hypothetical protein HY495_02655 [Candidatus Woesearchaeota archaeon]|nr:hypothetical protein [Candidatus Woesearchaeota archaeon]
MKKVLLTLLVLIVLFVVACAPGAELPAEEGFDDASALVGQATELKFSCSKEGDADSSEFVKGTLEFTKKGKSYSYEDKCYKDGLIEYYCNEGKGVSRVGVKCENGCENGACVQADNINGAVDPSLYDLSFYPKMFAADGKFNGSIVLGASGSAISNLVATDMAIYSGLKYGVSTSKLDDEISLEMYEPPLKRFIPENLIVIGSPCENDVTTYLLEQTAYACGAGFVEVAKGKQLGMGKFEAKFYTQLGNYTALAEHTSRIKLIHKSGFYYLLVYGHHASDSRTASKVLSFRSDEVSGTEVEITSSGDYILDGWKTATIKKIS